MRILVTGGLGFIGHNVVVQLAAKGHDVRIVDSETDYGIIPFDEMRYIMAERKQKIPSSVIKHQIDVESGVLRHVFDMFYPEAVVHLASVPRQRVVNANPQLGSRVMIEGLINVLELSVKHKVEKFVYVSSSMVYGSFEKANEDTECRPMGQYAIMKYTSEKLVQDYSRRTGIDHVIVRPSAVYGPLDIEDRVVSKFMLGAMRGEKLQVRGPWETLDFTHVDDVTDGIVKATLDRCITWGTYNLSRGRVRTLQEAAELAIKIAGSGSVEIQASDPEFPSRGILDTGAAVKDLKFDPKIDIENGFVDYYNWLQASPYFTRQVQAHA